MGRERNSEAVDFSLVKIVRKQNPSTAKNLLKKLKRKAKAANAAATSSDGLKRQSTEVKASDAIEASNSNAEAPVDVEYVPEELKDVGEFGQVFQKFSLLERIAMHADDDYYDATLDSKIDDKNESLEDEFDDSESDEDESRRTMGARKRQKLANRPTLAQLKQMAQRPDLVEFWDTTASDPQFLIWLKAQRNSVLVPAHWKDKTRYMQNRRLCDKPQYKLPPYIEATKIAQIRSALQEREANKSLKQKQREKARPKAHRMDIDYQTLHDAFFKYATKPPLTTFGDVYFEGKEMELKMRRFKPGQMSERLKQALGVGENAPPPWLVNMQRYGPPPSYPNLRIPGVNAPLPQGTAFGYHAGGWGQLPVDDDGNPIYGFVDLNYYQDNHINKSLWGELPDDEDFNDADVKEADDGEDDTGDASDHISRGQSGSFSGSGGSIDSLDGVACKSDSTREVNSQADSLNSSAGRRGLDEEDDVTIEKGSTRVVAPTPTAMPLASTASKDPLDNISAVAAHQVPRKAYTVLEPKIASASSSSAGSLFGSQVVYAMPPPPVATPLGPSTSTRAAATSIASGLVTPSLNIQDGTSTTDRVMKHLEYHETKAKLAQEAAGQLVTSTSSDSSQAKKKKRKFKF